jgi:hypothetical protein
MNTEYDQISLKFFSARAVMEFACVQGPKCVDEGTSAAEIMGSSKACEILRGLRGSNGKVGIILP